MGAGGRDWFICLGVTSGSPGLDRTRVLDRRPLKLCKISRNSGSGLAAPLSLPLFRCPSAEIPRPGLFAVLEGCLRTDGDTELLRSEFYFHVKKLFLLFFIFLVFWTLPFILCH